MVCGAGSPCASAARRGSRLLRNLPVTALGHENGINQLFSASSVALHSVTRQKASNRFVRLPYGGRERSPRHGQGVSTPSSAGELFVWRPTLKCLRREVSHENGERRSDGGKQRRGLGTGGAEPHASVA